MADPTQALRSSIASGLKSIVPANSPLAQSGSSAISQEDAIREQMRRNAAAQGIPSEEENLVQLREQPTTQQMQQDFVDPNIPITPAQPQAIETQRQPAQATQAQPTDQAKVSGVPSIPSADSGFDAIAKQQDAFQKSLEDDMKRREEFAAQKTKEVEDQLAKINANPQQLDNRSLWAKSSTGQKVVLALGALLSSLSPSSSKAFQENIKNTIDNDLKAQMDAINSQREDKKSLLSQLKQITGDLDSAQSAYKSQVYGILANKLQLQAQKSQSQLQRQQALQNYEIAKQNSELEKAQLFQKLKEKQDEGTVTGFEGQVKDPVAAREFRTKIAEKPAVENEIKNLLEINKQFLGGSLSPSARASATQSQNLLIGKLREAIVGPGTLSESDRGLLEDAIANPTDFFSLGSSNKIKLEKLLKSYNNALQTHAQALGLRQVGRPASFQGK
jgi:demethoxyubiquinone hydroxylase (CLK1/Coq7/Cat5 family)